MNKIIIFSLLFLLIPLSQIYGFENTKITGENKDSKITIEFSDKKLISYSLEFMDSSKQKIESDNSRFKIRDIDNRFYIIDRENGVFILGKTIEDKKWLILSKIKIDSEKITKRWIIDIEPVKIITGQRDLSVENNSPPTQDRTENSFKESQHLDKADKIAQAKKIYQEQLERLESENNNLAQTKTEVDYEKYEEYKKTIFDRDDDKPRPPVKIETKDIGSLQLFLSVPKHIEWKDNLVFDVLVTDESKHKYESNYNAFVGNGIKDTIVSYKIISSDKITLYESDGNTDPNGFHKDSFLIPDQSTTRGAYTLEVTATKSINDVILKEKSKAEFFVNPISNNSFNDPPIAKILPIDPIITINQTSLIIDEIKNELVITAQKYNSTHFLGKPDFPINDKITTKSQYANYEQLKSLLENTDIVKKDKDDNLIWSLNQTKNIILDGSKSSDPDDTVLIYLWKLINPENNQYKIDESQLSGSKPEISINAKTKEIFEFELIVSDNRKQSIPVYANVTIYNGTLYYQDGKMINMN